MKLSAEQWKEVARRYAAGETSTALAQEFGVHYITILTGVRRLGGAVRTTHGGEGPIMTKEVKAKIDEMADAGMRGAEIARELGLNPTLVTRYRPFPRVKGERPIHLGKKERKALAELLDTLRKFRATDKGLAQRQTVDPQIKALRSVLG